MRPGLLVASPTRRRLVAAVAAGDVYAEAGQAWWHSTGRKVTARVNELVAAGWVESSGVDRLPGQVLFRLTDPGRRVHAGALAPPLNRLRLMLLREVGAGRVYRTTTGRDMRSMPDGLDWRGGIVHYPKRQVNAVELDRAGWIRLRPNSVWELTGEGEQALAGALAAGNTGGGDGR